jgi:serine/threonine protein kinase
VNTTDSITQILGIVRGLQFMHFLKVVHGDIKAVRLVTIHIVGITVNIVQINVLVDGDRNARLADFGLVSALSNASIATSHFTSGGARGTARWMAPELFTDSESPRSDVSDIYALTITVWEVRCLPGDCPMLNCVQIFTLQTPFSHIKNDYAVLFRAQHGERPPKPEGCEAIGFIDELWEVMQQGWATEPQSRQPLSAFADLLQRL